MNQKIYGMFETHMWIKLEQGGHKYCNKFTRAKFQVIKKYSSKLKHSKVSFSSCEYTAFNLFELTIV